MIEYHVVFVALLAGTEAFFTALAVLNLRHGDRTLDRERKWVEETLGIDDVGELADYHRATTGFSSLRAWVGIGATLVVLYSGVFREAVLAVRPLGLGPWAEGVVFLVGVLVVVQVFSWPFDAVDTFVVEDIFGFNEQSPRLWLRDQLMGVVVTVAIASVLVGVLVGFLTYLPTLWWIAFWVVFVAFSLSMQVVYPRVIAPLFYDFEAIEEGDLWAAVEEVFEQAGFSCEQVYEMDASSRSSYSNAYFIGFGHTRRVVLFDTLVEEMTHPQIQGVLAHELAHWKKAHVWKRLAANAVQIGIVLAVVGLLIDAPWLYAMFGVPADAPYAGFALAVLWVGPINRWLAPIENKLYLKHEREADAFATDIVDGEHLTEALATLASDNLSNPFPHPWYAAFHYTHPPVPDRIRYIRDRTDADPSSSGPGAGGGGDQDTDPDPDADPDPVA
jgi:STE24 endopeptidase